MTNLNHIPRRTRSWRPKKWRAIYDEMLALYVYAKMTPSEIGERLWYSEFHVDSILTASPEFDCKITDRRTWAYRVGLEAKVARLKAELASLEAELTRHECPRLVIEHVQPPLCGGSLQKPE